MYSDELREFLSSNDVSAKALLLERVPNADKKFKRHIKELNKLMNEIKLHFPDASYYLSDDHIHLMLGEDHSGRYGKITNFEFSADNSHFEGGGGGW